MRAAAAKVWVEFGVWLALAIVGFILSYEFADELGAYRWGPASWPRAMISLLVLSAVLNCATSLRALPRSSPSIEPTNRVPMTARLRVLGLFALALAYVFLLPRTGFYLATPVFLLAYLYLLGERRWGVLIFATALIYFSVNLIFTVLFYVALPVGVWPGFYDIGNGLLSILR